MSHYVDANFMHDVTTGKMVTGILHLVNKTPLEWYSKKQPTVETATYGSEFVAACTCVEQNIDLCTTLRYLGVLLSMIRATCRETTNLSLIVPCKSTQNSTSATQSYLSTVLENVLQLRWLDSTNSWQIQSCRYIEQALGLFTNLDMLEDIVVLDGRYK
jgi:hypothetical protein